MGFIQQKLNVLKKIRNISRVNSMYKIQKEGDI